MFTVMLIESVLDQAGGSTQVTETECDVLGLLDGSVGSFHGTIGVWIIKHVENLIMSVHNGLIDLLELNQSGIVNELPEFRQKNKIRRSFLAAEQLQNHFFCFMGYTQTGVFGQQLIKSG